MKCTADKIINLAKSQVGYTEKKTNNNILDFTANAGSANWNKYAAFIDEKYPEFYNGRKNGYDWCDIFVDYLFLYCFGLKDALRLLCQPLKSGGAGCTVSRSYYIKAKQFYTSPKVGDQIFFTNNGGVSCYHTGIVVEVGPYFVKTIEGNSGNKVAERSYKLTDSRIAGYGRPNYDGEDDKMKTEVEIAKEVVAGLHGNGNARRNKLIEMGYNPDNIQAIVNTLTKGEQLSDDKKEFILNVDPKKYNKIIINLTEGA